MVERCCDETFGFIRDIGNAVVLSIDRLAVLAVLIVDHRGSGEVTDIVGLKSKYDGSKTSAFLR
jgi:hypothetical protein